MSMIYQAAMNKNKGCICDFRNCLYRDGLQSQRNGWDHLRKEFRERAQEREERIEERREEKEKRKGKESKVWVEHGALYIKWESLLILSSLFDHSEPRNN